MKLHALLFAVYLPLAGIPLQSHAAEKVWDNGWGSFTWDLFTPNWSSETDLWSDGDDAVFGATGVGTLTLGSPILVHDQTFNAPGYTFGGGTMTLVGANPTITVNADATNAASINGTNGLTIRGTGVLALKGDGAFGNTYTGGTYVRSGTLLLGVQGANAGGSSYAVDSIEALDAGATVKFDTIFNGTSFVSPTLHQVATHSSAFRSRLRMTGGTFDLNNETRNQRLPIPDGTGLIINTGTNVQSGLILVADGQDHEFSGVIADGGPLVGDNNAAGPTPQGPGRQIGIVNIAAGINGGVWTLSGSNTYSGSTRLQFGSIRLARGGTIGFPSSNGLTGPLRIYGPSFLDLNGHNQTIALMTGGDAGGKIFNSAVGTVSTLTFGYGNETSPSRNANMQYIDNPGVGGVLALTKIGATCIQILSGVNTYSGDTTVSEGTLAFATASAVSPNSTFRLSSGAVLALNYSGNTPVRQLFIDGVQKPPGTYGAETAPITGTGTITVRSPKVWDNGWGTFIWDIFTPNWSSETVLWTDGDDAIFGPTEVGTITLGGPVAVRDQTFNVAGYTIAGGGNAMTLVGVNPTITINADATNAASLQGTNGLTIRGTGVLTLKGDGAIGNTYTGGTYVRSGTLLLGVQGANASGSSYAVDSIEALDAGATVKFDTILNGSTYVSPTLHQVASHSTAFRSRLRMTGGTFDLNNEPRNQRLPVPEGTGLIINTGTNVQSGLIMVADGQDREFSGVIADGGPLVGDNNASGPTPQGPGRQIGIVNFGGQINGGGGVWTLSGSNTYSGSTRIDNGASIKLARGGTIGFPTPNGLTGPLRIYGSAADPRRGYLDLNGHNQTIALMQNGNADGKVFNSAVGTVSTLTFGYGNEQNLTRNASFQFTDNQGTGGVLALRKIGATCIQTLSGVNSYSGDTTVSEGTLAFTTTTAVSPNSTFRLSSGAPLALNYSGDASVRQLFIDGVQKPPGTYGAETAPITGTGTITVTGQTPTLGFSRSGETLQFSWQGAYKLQSATNNILGPWFDYPNGNTSPVSVTVDPATGAVFFRLSNL